MLIAAWGLGLRMQSVLPVDAGSSEEDEVLLAADGAGMSSEEDAEVATA